MIESNLERKGLFQLLVVCHKEKSGKELETGIEAEGMEECSLLALLVHSVCFFIHPRTICPGLVLPTVGWALIHNQEMPTCLSVDQSDGIFLVEILY